MLSSTEVQDCLSQLRQRGHDAELLLEVSLASSEDRSRDTADLAFELRAPAPDTPPVYRLDRNDADYLSSVGISPSRHRSAARGRPACSDDQPPGQDP